MEKLRHGSLFSGIGGFDLAAEWMGWENVFHCEWMEFPRKVLDYHFPNADSYVDICKTDFRKYANRIDILTGGFPCQPFSLAGKRKGTNDERYLWGEMLRAIKEIKPQFVIAENVFGITNIDGGLVFEEVCAELESYGYQVAPVIIPACGVGAPHKRERIWFVAYAESIRRDGGGGRHRQDIDKDKTGICEYRSERSEMGAKSKRHSKERNATNATGFGFCGNGTTEQSQPKTFRTWDRMGPENATNTNGNGFNQCNSNDEINASETRINAQRNIKQIPPNWKTFPTQSPVCSGDDGLPGELDGITFSKWRAESIKAYGNAIVPQVAYQIFKALEKSLYL